MRTLFKCCLIIILSTALAPAARAQFNNCNFGMCSDRRVDAERHAIRREIRMQQRSMASGFLGQPGFLSAQPAYGAPMLAPRQVRRRHHR